MSEYFSKAYRSYKIYVKIELDIFKYATATDIKQAIVVVTSASAKIFDLMSLKLDVHCLDINR